MRSPAFVALVDLTVRTFLCARSGDCADQVLSTVCALADSDLPCFQHRMDVLCSLRARLMPELSAVQAAAAMRKLVVDAAAKWTTTAYDALQMQQNHIYY